MDDKLKRLIRDLGMAINESLSESEAIAQAIGEIKHAGYDVFLVLEATIGFSAREDQAQREGEAGSAQRRAERIRLTIDDHEFLKKMKISALD